MPTLSVWGPLGAPTEKPPLPPFPRPQAWKLAALGGLNGPGNKAPEQFKDSEAGAEVFKPHPRGGGLFIC